MRVWRICKERHADEAFSGEGARRVAGRWNQRGVPLVYTARTLALAALETFVHVDPDDMPDDLVAIPAEVPAGRRIEALDVSTLPAHWRASPGPDALRDIGGQWFAAKTSMALRVPSAVLHDPDAPDEHNVLLNPEHPDFPALVIGAPRPFVFDPRMRR